MARLLQVIPAEGFHLYGAMVQKEIDLSRKKKGTFYRSGPKARDRAKWAHSKYSGRINLVRADGGVVTAEIRSKSSRDDEWQLLQAFIGWLDRHFDGNLEAINIQFRG